MLAALKPKSIKYPKTLNTLGDHIRQKRLDLALLQSDVARLLNANEITIYNWENNRNVPQVHRIPKILAFLEYNPLSAGGSVLEKLTEMRRTRGLSQRAMAKRLGIDPCTLRNWENRKRSPSNKLRRKIADFLQTNA